jgi:HD-like signal output (HDOD) protein
MDDNIQNNWLLLGVAMSATSSNTMVNDIREPVFVAEDHSITEVRNDLLLQIRSGDDFPVTSAAINIIGQLTCEREVPVAELANAVLGDYGLTSKLLKLINSVYYLRFGEVTTVSRAIILLGTDHLRDIALSVTLFERLQIDASQEMINALCRAVYAAVVGRRIASATGYTNPEEAFICSLFHTLGEMLTAYYAPGIYAALSNASPSDESKRMRASLLYLSLGKEIAQGWRFPARIVRCMERPTVEMKEDDDVYRLCCISVGANEVAHIVEEDLEPELLKKKLETALKKAHLPPPFIQSGKVDISAPAEDVQKYCALYGITFERSAIARSLIPEPEEAEVAVNAPGEPLSTVSDDANICPSTEAEVSSFSDIALSETESQDDPETVFVRGLREVGDAFLEECPLDDILTIILETMYRGLKPFGLSRTLLVIRDTHRPVMEVRLALGDSLSHLKSWFSIPIKADSPDLFNVALSAQKNMFVSDSAAREAQQQVPGWLLEHTERPVAIGVLPLHIKKISIGMIYLEGEKDFFKTVPQNYLNYLNILHQQAVLAIRQR